MSAGKGPEPQDGVPPSVLAAQQSARSQPRDRNRAYPYATASSDIESCRHELAATQALLRAESAADVGAVVATLVRDLGGALVPARYADPATVIPLDVSLGLSEPLLPFADPVSVATMRLTVVMPTFLETARVAIRRLERAGMTNDPGEEA